MKAGTGTDHSNPMSENIISGTHTQCTSLLVGFWWLSPYSERSEASGAMAVGIAVGENKR